jgi:hypothetical protein
MVDVSRRGFLGGAVAVGASFGLVEPVNAQIYSRSAALLGRVYDPSAAAYFDAMAGKPSAAARALIDTFIRGEKADGSWVKTRMMIIAMLTEQAGLLNIINPAETASNVNGCTYTSLYGWAGDAVSKHVDMGRTFSDGGILSLNDAHAGASINQQNGATGNMTHIGSASGTSIQISARADGSNEVYRVNDGTNTNTSRTSSSRLGHRTGVRIDASTKRAYFAGVALITSSVASTSLSTGNVTVLRSNTVYCADRFDASYFGAALTDAQVLGRHNRLTALFAGLRAQ